MNTIQALLTRRSIRDYTPGTIENQKIMDILKAGMYAPSAFNKQPWKFIVIDQPQKLKELNTVLTHAGMLQKAAAAILVIADPSLQDNPGLYVQDCSAVTQNMLLAAHELELGAVWVGIYPFDEFIEGVKKFFSLPSELVPLSLIVMGIPAESPDPGERFNKDIIHFNTW